MLGFLIIMPVDQLLSISKRFSTSFECFASSRRKIVTKQNAETRAAAPYVLVSRHYLEYTY